MSKPVHSTPPSRQPANHSGPGTSGYRKTRIPPLAALAGGERDSNERLHISSGGEETGFATPAAGGADDDLAVSVDGGHGTDLALHVWGGVLDDAEGVDPELF
jgi:hypothetical protein